VHVAEHFIQRCSELPVWLAFEIEFASFPRSAEMKDHVSRLDYKRSNKERLGVVASFGVADFNFCAQRLRAPFALL